MSNLIHVVATDSAATMLPNEAADLRPKAVTVATAVAIAALAAAAHAVTAALLLPGATGL